MDPAPKAVGEKRRFERFQPPGVNLRVFKSPHIPLLSQPLPAELSNLSASGLRLKVTRPLSKGDGVTGTVFFVETRDTLKFGGKVTWVKVYAPEARGEPPLTVAGVAFDRVDPADQAKIESMRKWVTSERYKTRRLTR